MYEALLWALPPVGALMLLFLCVDRRVSRSPVRAGEAFLGAASVFGALAFWFWLPSLIFG